MLRLSHCEGVEFGEGLHPVDQFHDPIGLLADQAGKGAIVVARAGLQQLCGAANAGERVLDLVSEHEAESGN